MLLAFFGVCARGVSCVCSGLRAVSGSVGGERCVFDAWVCACVSGRVGFLRSN